MQTSALCRSRREFSNEYLLAKFGFDTAENEPYKVWPIAARTPAAKGGGPQKRVSTSPAAEPAPPRELVHCYLVLVSSEVVIQPACERCVGSKTLKISFCASALWYRIWWGLELRTAHCYCVIVQVASRVLFTSEFCF